MFLKNLILGNWRFGDPIEMFYHDQINYVFWGLSLFLCFISF